MFNLFILEKLFQNLCTEILLNTLDRIQWVFRKLFYSCVLRICYVTFAYMPCKSYISLVSPFEISELLRKECALLSSQRFQVLVNFFVAWRNTLCRVDWVAQQVLNVKFSGEERSWILVVAQMGLECRPRVVPLNAENVSWSPESIKHSILNTLGNIRIREIWVLQCGGQGEGRKEEPFVKDLTCNISLLCVLSMYQVTVV